MPASVAAIEDAYTDTDFFETICQIRGDNVDDAGTHELVHHVRDIAAPDEQALGSFTPPKLKQFPFGISGSYRNGNSSTLTRSRKSLVYLALSQLEPRYCVPIGITSLSRVALVKLACAVMDPSAPIQSFAQTYASCTDQPCMRLFFALSTAISFVVLGADCSNAYASSPSPTQPTYVRINDAFADWYRLSPWTGS